MSREENRFQEEKHKVKTKKLYKDVYHDEKLSRDEAFIGKEAHNHGKTCSCPMCCNPRRNPWLKNKLSRQEQKAELDAEEEMLDESSEDLT